MYEEDGNLATTFIFRTANGFFSSSLLYHNLNQSHIKADKLENRSEEEISQTSTCTQHKVNFCFPLLSNLTDGRMNKYCLTRSIN